MFGRKPKKYGVVSFKETRSKSGRIMEVGVVRTERPLPPAKEGSKTYMVRRQP